MVNRAPEPTGTIMSVAVNDYFSLLRKTCEEIVTLAEAKGAQYWDAGPFQAFEEISHATGLTKETVLMVLASKHWGALIKSAQAPHKNPALTQERLKDVILYMLIFYAMVQELIDDERYD